jgi:hypothetical protein
MKWYVEVFIGEILQVIASAVFLALDKYELAALFWLMFLVSYAHRNINEKLKDLSLKHGIQCRNDASIARLSALQDSNAAGNSTAE